MGMSDPILYRSLYYPNIEPKGEVGLLGFTENSKFEGDLYDLQLGNWEINSDWSLNKKYDTLICLRTAWFSKKPKDFLKRCYDSLNPGGVLYVDWGFGDHWRFKNFKVGWVKDGEHEFAYKDDNFLWSAYWGFDILKDLEAFQGFMFMTMPKYYNKSIEDVIKEEIPSILTTHDIEENFHIRFVNDYVFGNPVTTVGLTAHVFNHFGDAYYALLTLEKK